MMALFKLLYIHHGWKKSVLAKLQNMKVIAKNKRKLSTYILDADLMTMTSLVAKVMRRVDVV